MNSMVHMKLCLMLFLTLVLNQALALDVSEWSGTSSEKILNFFHRHKTKPVIVVNAEGVLWPSNILLRFFKHIDSQIYIRKKLKVVQGIDLSVSLSESYKKRCVQNRELCYAWSVSVFRGIKERILFQWARNFWDTMTHTVYLKPVSKLLTEFQKHHFPVWVVTPIPKWIAEIGALKYNIGPTHVIATTPVLHRGIITQRLSYPVPYEIQKVFLTNRLIKTKPFIVIGHNYKDYEILNNSQSMSFIINPPTNQTDRNNIPFISTAKDMGWLIQNFPKTEY
jgi:hypothetical protein